jgi:hypothetical protein
MILEKSAIDPEELRGGVLRRHCYIIAKDGIKSVLEDSNYGRACDCKICHNAPWQNLAAEPYREYFKIGPNGQPYKSGYKANEAAYRANRLWAEEFGGHFDFYAEPISPGAGRLGTLADPAYLRIRFIPDTTWRGGGVGAE